jgi:hypothetical protein
LKQNDLANHKNYFEDFIFSPNSLTDCLEFVYRALPFPSQEAQSVLHESLGDSPDFQQPLASLQSFLNNLQNIEQHYAASDPGPRLSFRCGITFAATHLATRFNDAEGTIDGSHITFFF